MRRKDRETTVKFAQSVVDKCEFAVLGMVDCDGKPYLVPLSICRNDNVIYFHCAKSGKKAEILGRNSKVCLSCVGDTRKLTDKFTTEFESAYVEGTASEVLEDEEKVFALKLLCERHTPANMREFERAIESSLSRTAVWKIETRYISGKRKKYAGDGSELKFGRTD